MREVFKYKFAIIILPSFGLSPFPVIVANEDRNPLLVSEPGRPNQLIPGSPTSHRAQPVVLPPSMVRTGGQPGLHAYPSLER